MANPQASQSSKETAPQPPPVAVDPEVLERDKRKAEADDLRKKTKHIKEALAACPDLGLNTFGVALLAVHIACTDPDSGAWNEKETVAWAKTFARLNPVLWKVVREGNAIAFHAQLKRHRIDAPRSSEYANLVALVRAG
jgi:hypothetical protein